MIKKVHFIIILVFVFCFLSCKSENNKIEQFEKITVDKNLSKSDSFKIFSKYPELKLFNSEKIESPTRTAYIVQEDGFYINFYENFSSRKKKI